MTPFVRSAYNYDMNQAGDESALECKDPTLTQQQFKDEVDINTIVERFGLTGEVPTLTKLPSYDDFSGIFDYQTAMNAIVAARETFDSLPAKMRARFDNNPAKFVDFFDDEDNRPEAYRMGLLVEPPKPTPQDLAATGTGTKSKEKQGDTPKTPKE